MPLAPLVIVIHDALLEAVQAQAEAFAVTDTVPLPPADVGELAVGDSENAQTIPACVMVKVCPATVMVALRWVVPEFAATL